jgi:hypothetical protein
MTPDERNQFYEIFMMINTSLELIIKRAKKIQKDCLDPHIYTTELTLNCAKNAKDILDMAESIEHRKKPALTLIEEQRKHKPGNERPFPV